MNGFKEKMAKNGESAPDTSLGWPLLMLCQCLSTQHAPLPPVGVHSVQKAGIHEGDVALDN